MVSKKFSKFDCVVAKKITNEKKLVRYRFLFDFSSLKHLSLFKKFFIGLQNIIINVIHNSSMTFMNEDFWGS